MLRSLAMAAIFSAMEVAWASDSITQGPAIRKKGALGPKRMLATLKVVVGGMCKRMVAATDYAGMGGISTLNCEGGGATAAQLRQIQIRPARFGIYFPQREVDTCLPTLLQGFLGSRAWAGRAAKLAAVQRNGKLGGRPKVSRSRTRPARRKAIAAQTRRTLRKMRTAQECGSDPSAGMKQRCRFQDHDARRTVRARRARGF